MRQGPHHSAQKSTIFNPDPLRISVLNEVSDVLLTFFESAIALISLRNFGALWVDVNTAFGQNQRNMFFLAIPIPTEVRVSVLNRVFAKGIDFLCLVLFSIILPFPIGPFVGFFYSIFADGLPIAGWEGQSLGKRLLHLKVISTKRGGAPCTFRESVIRNAPVGVATFFALIPIWGWLIVMLLGLPLLLIEIYLMLTVEKGHRLGDVMGDTEVVEVPKSSQV